MSAAAEVLAAAARIVDDFGHHRTADYFSRFSEDATFVFHTHTERLDSREDYETLWAAWEHNEGFRVHGCRSRDQKVQMVGDSAAIFTHYVESDIEFSGETSTVNERETIVFERTDSGWLAVHEHLSPDNPA